MPQTGKRNNVLATNVNGAQRSVMCVQAAESGKEPTDLQPDHG